MPIELLRHEAGPSDPRARLGHRPLWLPRPVGRR
ncbi:hypothetical protein DER29_2380 [Micromonospora sp. M71_S20]|nr:hypothetical protein DER29_2380 [Micromonospora sp. M71_S20]